MNLEIIRNYCLSKNGTSEDSPFDNDTIVFRICGKIYCLISMEKPDTVNLKCDPEKAVELREEHPEIIPGFHMNKKHWNTVSITGTLHDNFILGLIDHSYDMVFQNLPKKSKELLQ